MVYLELITSNAAVKVSETGEKGKMQNSGNRRVFEQKVTKETKGQLRQNHCGKYLPFRRTANALRYLLFKKLLFKNPPYQTVQPLLSA
jgi:hypothetical protein